MAIHFFVAAIVSEETCVVVRVLRCLGVAEEVDELFEVLRDPSKLLRSVAVHIGVILLRRLFERVCLGDLLVHRKHFLDAALRVSARQVTLSKHEPHHVLELWLRVHH